MRVYPEGKKTGRVDVDMLFVNLLYHHLYRCTIYICTFQLNYLLLYIISCVDFTPQETRQQMFASGKPRFLHNIQIRS